jgi:transmembrane sensor
MDYSAYGADDFLRDASFRRWVLKTASGDEQFFWDNYYLRQPAQQAEMDRAAAWIRDFRSAYNEISEEEIDDEVDRLVASARGTRKPFFRIAWGAVAAVVLTAGLFWWTQRPARIQPVAVVTGEKGLKEHAYLEKKNSSAKPMLVTLDDKSSVLLQPNSRIVVGKSKGTGKREVFLDGEAFFEVRKDPANPFYVYTQGLVARVLGTSFSVASRNKIVTVTVKTGKVSVFPDEEAASASGVVLTPNQRLTFREQQMTFSKIEDAEELTMPIQQLSFDFRRTPLSEVFAALEKAYGIPIRYDKELLGRCQLTALLGDEPLPEKLNLISRTMELDYTLSSSEIVIRGTGCKQLIPLNHTTSNP